MNTCNQQEWFWHIIPGWVQDIANFAVNEHNKRQGGTLKLENIISGWYSEMNDEKIRYRLQITASDNKGVVGLYEATVLVEEKDGKRVRTFIPLYAGYIDEKSELFWNVIPDLEEDCVQEISKFGVEKNNENTNDNLKYVRITSGFFNEVNANTLSFNIVLKAKDCLGRLREYQVMVQVEKPLTRKIRTLNFFQLIHKSCP